MAPRKNNSAWWDWTWNTMGGCRPISGGCLNCFAARDSATLQASLGVELYDNTTKIAEGRYTFNGELRSLPPAHEGWSFPLRWAGAADPWLGEGQPSLLFVNGLTEIFLRGRPEWVIDRTFGTVVSSRHIGLILTKLPKAMVAYIKARHPATLPRWRRRLWLGFSAEDQADFDLRWPVMRALAERGFTVFVSIAPMLGPVRLPDDFLAVGKWVIVSGEQGPHRLCRPMDLLWARALRDQCASAGIAFFMKQMGRKRPIPPDLLIREFPAIR
jgi:protein gp37